MGVQGQLKEELKYEIIGITLVALGVLGLVSILSPSSGLVSGFVDRVLKFVAGEGRYFFPFLMITAGVRLMIKRKKTKVSERMFGAMLLFLIILVLLHLVLLNEVPLEGFIRAGSVGDGGGILGGLLGYLLGKSFGPAGTYIVLLAAALVALLLLTGLSVASLAGSLGVKIKDISKQGARGVYNFVYPVVEEEKESRAGSPVIIDHEAGRLGVASPPRKEKENQEITGGIQATSCKKQENISERREEDLAEPGQKDSPPDISPAEGRDFHLPPLTILSRPYRIKNVRLNKDINENIRILEETLESFGVKVKVTQVSRGPAITRYEIQPPAGVKVSRIVGLADDIALSMAAPDVRIEAPIPGKAAVGIEVPNKEISMVHLRELLEAQEYQQPGSKLTIALGKDIAGNPIVADLTRMPHLLIAGATGSGKSVCLNTLIVSILFKATPDEVKILMVDPKMVELATYNGIPHLVSPVVTEPKKAAGALRWAVREMERRYELFASTGVRDITRYNKLFKTKEQSAESRPLPLIVVIIDELADLMMVAPADVEDAVCRLAQMARAAGIHLVVATQRPSVDVITGLIKANIPSRISFAVSSQIDSRTILDMAGAEKLLGKGDMLFFPVGAPKPVRVQGAYLSDREVEDLVNFLKKQAEPVYDEKVLVEAPQEEEPVEMEDELLAQAVQILIESGHASISMLQRRLHIGYARAARLIDIMEKRGIVGGYEGSKPRAILMTMEQFNQVFKKGSQTGFR